MMLHLIRISCVGRRVCPGDSVRKGGFLGINPRTLEMVTAPSSGLIADSFCTSRKNSLILVIMSYEGLDMEGGASEGRHARNSETGVNACPHETRLGGLRPEYKVDCLGYPGFTAGAGFSGEKEAESACVN